MPKQPQKLAEHKDMPWSHLGKDALDAAAERVWNILRDEHMQLAITFDGHADPYHLASSASQAVVQRAVIDLFGHAVPRLMREYAKAHRADGASEDDMYYLLDLADELEAEHG